MDVGGREVLEILARDFGEQALVFTEEQEGFGVHAVFEGVPGGTGLAFGGARAGRFFRALAVGLDLLFGEFGSHGEVPSSRYEGSTGGAVGRLVVMVKWLIKGSFGMRIEV
jgi:hypothetical protein